MTTDRLVAIVLTVSPAELRHMAWMLEQNDCKEVALNWYHTEIVFKNKDRVKGIETPYNYSRLIPVITCSDET